MHPCQTGTQVAKRTQQCVVIIARATHTGGQEGEARMVLTATYTVSIIATRNEWGGKKWGNIEPVLS